MDDFYKRDNDPQRYAADWWKPLPESTLDTVLLRVEKNGYTLIVNGNTNKSESYVFPSVEECVKKLVTVMRENGLS